MIELGERLPALRRRVARDLGRRGLPRDRVLAAVVGLLERTALRIGNEEYARLNRSFGLSTLRNRHVRVAHGSIQFRFRGKAGKELQVDVDDRRLAAVVRRCQELPGQALFEYVERSAADGDTSPQPIDSDDVNDYIRAAIGSDFSAKDLRTWAGTMRAFRALRVAAAPGRADAPPPNPRKLVLEAVRQTAAALGNTPAVARSSYVHPAVLEAAIEMDPDATVETDDAPLRAVAPTPRGRPRSARAEELALLRLLRKRKADSERKVRRRNAQASIVTRSQDSS